MRTYPMAITTTVLSLAFAAPAAEADLPYAAAHVDLELSEATICETVSSVYSLDLTDLDTTGPDLTHINGVAKNIPPGSWLGVPFCYYVCQPGWPSPPCVQVCPHEMGTKFLPNGYLTIDFAEETARLLVPENGLQCASFYAAHVTHD